MSPRYRMLATDLDGTLFSTGGGVSPGNREAIRQASARGIPIVLCSGRAPWEGVAKLGEDLGLNYSGNYYICCNGALLVDAVSLETLEGFYLPKNAAAKLIAAAETFPEQLRPHWIRMCTTGPVYYWSREPEDRTYTSRFGLEELALPEDLAKVEGEITKLLFLSHAPDFAFDFIREMTPFCPPEALGYLMPPVLAEYVSFDAKKGNMVSRLAARLGIPMEEVICVGDSYNDLSMIEDAGLGIAVRNAEKPVQEKADLVLEFTNDEDAVGRIIEKYLL